MANADAMPSRDVLDALAQAVAGRLGLNLPPRGPAGPAGPGGEPDLESLASWPGLQSPDARRPVLQVGARIGLDGVEYTQSTQFNSTVTPRYGNDNAVPLVGWKTMVVRAYPSVRRGQFGGDDLTNRNVSGELVLSIGERIVFRTGPTRSGGARLGPAARLSRLQWDREITLHDSGGIGPGTLRIVRVNCPLNFMVPAYWCRPGRMLATLRLWPADEGPMSARVSTHAEYLWFEDVPAPKVCLVRVNWTDANGNVNRPGDAAMLATLSLAERMLPFPYFDTTILGTEVTSGAAFATAATNGGCNAAWSSLVTELNVTRIFTALFQLGDIVYGMVPTAAIPAGAGSINSGCGRGAGGGFVGYASTFAHEVGHLYGRPHVAVPGDTGSDPSYPNYGGSSTSIGECGIDTGTTPPTLFDPKASADIMSYGGNPWISPYTYQKILDARAMHQAAPVDPRRLRSRLVLDFRVVRALEAGPRLELKAVAQVKAPGLAPPKPADAPSPLSIDLLDGHRRVIATHHCVYEAPRGGGGCGCGCGCGQVPLEREPWLDFSEVLEWPDEAVAAIAFHRGGEPFHVIDVGEPPSVSISGPRQREGRLAVAVRADHPRERVSLLVLFSADPEGLDWQLIAVDPPNGEVVVDAQALPGGERCRFRALATAELRTAQADTEPFALPRQPRRLFLGLPPSQCPVPAGPVSLAVHVDNRGLGALAPADIEWRSSLDGAIGQGYAIAPDLGEGRHEITVTAADGLGGRLQERAIIIVSGRPR